METVNINRETTQKEYILVITEHHVSADLLSAAIIAVYQKDKDSDRGNSQAQLEHKPQPFENK